MPPSFRAVRAPFSHRLPSLALAVGTLLAGSALLYSPVSRAQPSQAPAIRYAIPAGPLAPALDQYARTARINISYDPELAAQARTAGLNGEYTVAAGLARLLQGTRLSAVAQPEGGYTLRAAPAGDVAQLSAITIDGRQEETATGILDGYIARRGITATKTDTPLIETPQSVSIVTRDQIVDQGSNSVRDALQYTPGIVSTEAGGVTTFAVRGFSAYGDSGSFYLDGTKYASNMYQGQPELYGLERIELLRGPASVLYGTSAPGGIINMISKRPTLTPLHELSVEYGSFDRKALAGDFGGPLSEDGVWSYRLTGRVQDSNTFVQHVPDDRRYLAPALTWAPSADTSLTLLANYRKTHTRYLYGLPSAGTLESTPNGKIPRHRFIGDPDNDRYNEEAYSAGYLFKHRFSDKVQFSQTLRYEKSSTDIDYATYRSYTDASSSIINRGFAGRTIDAHALTIDSNVSVDWGSDMFANQTLVGFDYVNQRQHDDRWNADIEPLDLNDPNYGLNLTNHRVSAAALKLFKEQMGVYLQNQIKIDQRWVVLLGGRYDWARTGDSPLGGEEDWTTQKSEKFTGRAGIVYLADNGLAPYISFSQSFEPTSGVGRNGTAFKPTQGEQYEIGVRYQPEGSDTQITATLFNLTQKNILTTDPVDTSFSTQTGKARSRGFELEAKTALTRNLTVTVGYAYTQTKVLESNYPEEKGGQLPFTPRHQVLLWAYYDNLLGIAGLKVGGGARYVGSSTGFYYIDGDVRPYMLFDAMASYNTGPWKFSLNVRNLTDKRYVSNCSYGCFYGEPRTVIGSVTYGW